MFRTMAFLSRSRYCLSSPFSSSSSSSLPQHTKTFSTFSTPRSFSFSSPPPPSKYHRCLCSTTQPLRSNGDTLQQQQPHTDLQQQQEEEEQQQQQSSPTTSTSTPPSTPPTIITTSTTTTKTTKTNNHKEPNLQQLRIVALRSAIPMIGFGFMDNLIMIQAGELIDLTIGVTFGLSTLTAAGLGQCVSDVAGFSCGGVVDALMAKLNLPHHNLSQGQMELKRTRMYHTIGGCVGVVLGCLLGMTTLLFMDTEKADRMKKTKELTSIFETVMVEGKTLVNAERCTLWMLSGDRKELWSRVVVGMEEITLPADQGAVGWCIAQNQVLNLHDAYRDARFSCEVDKLTGLRTKSVLIVPVLGKGGEAVGAIQMINKKNSDATDGVFDEGDVKLVKMLSSHVSSFIRIVRGR